LTTYCHPAAPAAAAVQAAAGPGLAGRQPGAAAGPGSRQRASAGAAAAAGRRSPALPACCRTAPAPRRPGWSGQQQCWQLPAPRSLCPWLWGPLAVLPCAQQPAPRQAPEPVCCRRSGHAVHPTTLAGHSLPACTAGALCASFPPPPRSVTRAAVPSGSGSLARYVAQSKQQRQQRRCRQWQGPTAPQHTCSQQSRGAAHAHAPAAAPPAAPIARRYPSSPPRRPSTSTARCWPWPPATCSSRARRSTRRAPSSLIRQVAEARSSPSRTPAWGARGGRGAGCRWRLGAVAVTRARARGR
jgi:hypothetical protein